MAAYEEEDRVNCREISSKISARYLGNKINLGKAANISESCICIDTKYCFPIDSELKLLIPFERDVLSVHGRVSSSTHRNNISETVSFSILNPSIEYMKYLESFSQTGRYCKQDDNGLKRDNSEHRK